MKKTNVLLSGLVYLVLTAGSIICIFPFLWMVRTALVDLGQIFQNPPKFIPDSLDWDNFASALSDHPFGTYFWNSILVTGLSVAGVLLTSSLCAYSFSRMTWPGRDRIFGILLIGLMLPFFVVMIPQFIGWKTLGLTDTLVPLIAPSWFGGGVFNIFLLRQFFMTIPKDMDEAAKMDGASHWQVYRGIILPISKQALIVVGLLTFLGSWNDFLGPLVFINIIEFITFRGGAGLPPRCCFW